ncbi:MAG: hypothetical protein GEU81_05525 [Nitriliruptorales bacterium]|nr:hypothetical protein [Nitriliruptorales bacterium]
MARREAGLIRPPAPGATIPLSLLLAAVVADDILPGAGLTLGPAVLGLTDVILAALLLTGLGRLLRRPRPVTGSVLALLLGVAALLSLLRGIGVHSTAEALAEARPWLAFLSATLFFSSLAPNPRSWDRLARVWLVAAGVLVFLLAVRGTAKPAAALLLVQAFFIALPCWRQDPAPVLRWAAPVPLAAVVVLGEPIAGLALLAGLAVTAARNRGLARRMVPLVVGAAALAAVLTLAVPDGPAAGLVRHGAHVPVAARAEGWRSLLATEGPQGFADTLLGSPFGGGFQREVSGTMVTVSPHSMVLEAALRLGMVGLGLLAACWILVVARLRRVAAGAGLLTAPTLLVLVVVQVGAALTATLGPEQGVVLGLALASSAEVPLGSPPPASSVLRVAPGTPPG